MSRSQSAIFRLIPHIQHIAHISHDTGRNISVSLVEKKTCRSFVFLETIFMLIIIFLYKNQIRLYDSIKW